MHSVRKYNNKQPKFLSSYYIIIHKRWITYPFILQTGKKKERKKEKKEICCTALKRYFWKVGLVKILLLYLFVHFHLFIYLFIYFLKQTLSYHNSFFFFLILTFDKRRSLSWRQQHYFHIIHVTLALIVYTHANYPVFFIFSTWHKVQVLLLSFFQISEIIYGKSQLNHTKKKQQCSKIAPSFHSFISFEKK